MGKNKQNNFFQMKASVDGKSADIFIYGEITKYAWEDYGEVSSIIFKNELEALGDGIETINLYINSPGGSVFEAMAMIAMLQRHPADIISHIDGVAASCASVLPMISKRIIMPSNSLMMVHHAMTGAWGNAKQLRKAADDVERISKAMCQYYLDRAGDKMSEESLYEMLEEDTWLTAEQCLELGLCDEIAEANQAVAYAFDDKWAKQYQNVPKQLLQFQSSKPTMSEDEKVLREKIAEEAKANAEYINTILGGIHL
ncbi:Clp protease ClpP [Bacillus manliponensis]|uniref:ATP-dependent Clp protease proteolytic subunit n=1 Tax=Bacillus manliponensis TaxID=574376 RepID=A0A073JSR6_9BACI|nr:head maturation protease, ClpP-related [Bacillus manliponensis]KEK17350.1 Clp protease ClpP [Bacillus manliponensis]